MNRKNLFDILDPIYPCYAIGEHEGKCISPYVVLKFDYQTTSVSNTQTGWQTVFVYCYAPIGDITVLDEMIPKVKNVLKDVLEDTGEITPEITEDEKKAYSRRIKYRIPKEVK